MLLGDGTVLTGTSPEAINPSVQVCHEIEPYCGAFRLNQRILASVCLHRVPDGQFLVLSPCGVCRERLATHGADVLVAVAGPDDPTTVQWVKLRDGVTALLDDGLPRRADRLGRGRVELITGRSVTHNSEPKVTGRSPGPASSRLTPS